MAAPLYTTSSGLLWHAGKILIVVAGLPARGKTHISRSLERYLKWNGVTTEVYSLGDYRRKTLGHAKDLPSDYFTPGPMSEETATLRNSVRARCEIDILDFFDNASGQVAIYDANNGTKRSRRALYDRFHKLGYHVIFLESVCTNQDIVLANIRSVKISSPDYVNWDPNQAVEDYMRRIQDHERHYEPVEEMDVPWIRLINVGERILINKIEGYLQSRIVFFLMNIHNRQRLIYFARSGQSLIEHSFRADSDLSPSGWDYASRLKNFMMERRYLNMEERKRNNGGVAEERNLVIWTSSRRRSHHTAWPFIKDNITQGKATTTSTSTTYDFSSKAPLIRSPADFDDAIPLPHEGGITVTGPSFPRPHANLNLAPNQLAYSKVKVFEKSRLCEINPGVWDGLSPDDVRTRYPEEWENFLRDPYGHRAPRAESYHDLCIRLEPILIELEDCKDDLLIISHASVIRCLLAYLVGLPAHEIPAVDIARGDLIEVQPGAYGVKTRMFHFWSGPGRKDVGDDATLDLDLGRVGSADLERSASEVGVSQDTGVNHDVGDQAAMNVSGGVDSPPRSVLHLERSYRSRHNSLADTGERDRGDMTALSLTPAERVSDLAAIKEESAGAAAAGKSPTTDGGKKKPADLKDSWSGSERGASPPLPSTPTKAPVPIPAAKPTTPVKQSTLPSSVSKSPKTSSLTASMPSIGSVASVLQSPTRTDAALAGGLLSAPTQGTLELDFGPMSPAGSEARVESGAQSTVQPKPLSTGTGTADLTKATDLGHAAAMANAAAAASSKATSPPIATSPPNATKAAAAEDAPNADALAAAIAKAKATEAAEEESPTLVFKTLPKLENSLGESDEAKFAARVAAADTRPTFYENVVEGTIKRKKLPGLGLNTANTTPIAKSSPLPHSQSSANIANSATSANTSVGGGPSYPGDGGGAGTVGVLKGAAAHVTAESVATPISSSDSLPPTNGSSP